MDEQQPNQPKKRGRPKKQPGEPKSVYNYSRAERARRETQKKVRAAKKRAAKTTQVARDQRNYAQKVQKAAGKVEKALQGKSTATIDMGDLQNLP